MPTTFNWISLGIPRNASNAVILVDPNETTSGAENAAALLTAASGTGARTFGSAGSPLYNNIVSATMINRSGDATTLETQQGTPVDQFSTNAGAGTQTFNFDALANYTGTVTYVDGTTATNVTLQIVQAETGELFLAPPPTTGSNPTLTAKPIASIQLGSVANNSDTTNTNLLVDRQLGIFDDGFVDGTSGNDSIVAGYVEPNTGGSDQVDGGDGLTGSGTGFNDDRIRAGAGNDTINGGLGADSIDAGDGNDLVNLTGTFGNDTVTGGTGSDTLSGATLAGATTVTFSGGAGTLANGTSTASFNTIEAIETGAGADTVTITGATAGVFTTGDGADIINAGGSGADTIVAGDGNDLVNLTGTFGNDTVTGGAGSDTLSGATLAGATTVTFAGGSGSFTNGTSTANFNTIEAVTTGAGADTVTITGATAGVFTTGDGADIINAGGSGADTILAGDGNDLVNLTGTFGNDTVTGGAGSDTLSGATLAGATTVTFSGGAGTLANGTSTASFNTIEAVTTGAGADTVTITGATAGVFTTGDGADIINAGGSGADTIVAGDGNDRINLGASHGNDTITGGAGADTLSGADLVTGQPATVTYTNGSGTFASSGGTASFNTIETVETGAGADAINASANAAAARFVTGAGNDSFTGGLGAETVDGGAGDDVILAGGGADSILAGDGNDRVEAGDGEDYVDAGDGTDTVEGGAGNDTILGGIGDDQLNGGVGNDSLFGGAGNDVLLGGDGNDYLEGGTGADTLTGGAGNDVFVGTSGDLITDFTAGDIANNDSVDLAGFYNDTNLVIINAQRVAAGLRPYDSALGWLKADQADDGVLNSIRTTAGFSENFTLRIQNGGTAVSASALTEQSTAVVCFGADAMIETAEGPVAAGKLQAGDMVLTRDDGYQPIRWIGQRRLDAATLEANPRLRPIRIGAGALGRGLPASDLIVSPQHRILVRSAIAERMFGQREVLVAAKQLMVTEGIDIADDLETVTYVHFLFDAHQIVVSNGAETESLHTGAEALQSVPQEARDEILALFPELAEGGVRPAARELLSGRMARKLAQRHARNGKKLVA